MLRRVILNSTVMGAAQVTVKGLGLLWLALIARHLGDEAFGRLSYAFSLASLVGILVEYGFSAVLTREVARRPEEAARYLSNVLTLRLGLSAVSIPLTVLVSLVTGASRATLGPVYVAAAATSVAGLYAISSSLFIGRERMEFPSGILVGSKLVAIGLGLLAIRLGAGVVGIALIFLLEPVLNLFVSIPLLRRHMGLRFVPAFDPAFCWNLVREATPFALALMLGLVYFRTDVVMLSAMKGSQYVGWYSAGYRLLEGLVYVPAAFVNTVYPTFSRLKTSSELQLRTAVARSWEFVVAFSLPVAIALTLTSDRLVPLLFGEEFRETVGVLRWIGPTLFFLFINNLLGMVLGAVDRQAIQFYASLAGVAVNVALNLVLIPRHAHLGAAQATFVTQVFLLAFFSVMTVRFTGARPGAVRTVKLALSGAVMAGVLLLWKDLPLLAALAVGAAVYLGAVLLTRAVTREEWGQIRRAVRPARGPGGE